MFAMEAGLCPPGKEVVVVHGCSRADAEDGLPMVAIQVGGYFRVAGKSLWECLAPTALRSLATISLHGMVMRHASFNTLRPSCLLLPLRLLSLGCSRGRYGAGPERVLPTVPTSLR